MRWDPAFGFSFFLFFSPGFGFKGLGFRISGIRGSSQKLMFQFGTLSD